MKKKYKFALLFLLVILLCGGGYLTLIQYHYHVQQNQIAKKEKAKQQFQRKQKFYKTHFYPQTKIYGIDVSDLTIKQAYNKVQQYGKNSVILTVKGKIKSIHNNKYNVIDISKINNLFDEQHKKQWNNSTEHVELPNVDLNNATHKLSRIKTHKVKFDVDNQMNYTLNYKILGNITYVNGQYLNSDNTKLNNLLSNINKKYSTLHKTYPFITPDNKKVNVTNQSYGWELDIPKLSNAIKSAFLNISVNPESESSDISVIKTENYLHGLEFLSYGTGFGLGKTNYGLGNSYVVVSIPQQKLWIYNKGKLVIKLDNIVSGTATGGKGNSTPPGVWYIGYKQSPSTLKGLNDDGTPYSSPVQYWMPFTESGCGLHDASWRTDWSKTAYLNNGSHGCINIPSSEIKSVWNHVYQEMPVIILNN